HFPAINWLRSYSLYLDQVKDWWEEKVSEKWYEERRETMRLLEKEDELQEIVQLVGPDALPLTDQFALHASRIIREDFLQQNAFHEVDTFCEPEKQFRMLQIMMEYYDRGTKAIQEGISLEDVTSMGVMDKISRMSNIPAPDWEEKFDNIEMQMNKEFGDLKEE
ncbi:MAG: V-type ATP synthase subunit A, partial [Thermoplasmatota archaeon]